MVLSFVACDNPKEHTAPAIYARDSVAMMTSYGVNTLISDSGIMKYRIVAERWEVNENLNPKRWIFRRGVFLEQFDEKFHVEAFIQADTAFYFTDQKLWHLIGNVRVRTLDGLRYSSEELYWNQDRHELYSNRFSRLITPEREMEGSYFRSNEQLTRYFISNSKGSFMQSDMFKEDTTSNKALSDSVVAPKRGMTMPHRKMK
jgi:LPS export ABC transporter protein LptC